MSTVKRKKNQTGGSPNTRQRETITDCDVSNNEGNLNSMKCEDCEYTDDESRAYCNGVCNKIHEGKLRLCNRYIKANSEENYPYLCTDHQTQTVETVFEVGEFKVSIVINGNDVSYQGEHGHKYTVEFCGKNRFLVNPNNPEASKDAIVSDLTDDEISLLLLDLAKQPFVPSELYQLEPTVIQQQQGSRLTGLQQQQGSRPTGLQQEPVFQPTGFPLDQFLPTATMHQQQLQQQLQQQQIQQQQQIRQARLQAQQLLQLQQQQLQQQQQQLQQLQQLQPQQFQQQQQQLQQIQQAHLQAQKLQLQQIQQARLQAQKLQQLQQQQLQQQQQQLQQLRQQLRQQLTMQKEKPYQLEEPFPKE